jgi:hypothetical protein
LESWQKGSYLCSRFEDEGREKQEAAGLAKIKKIKVDGGIAKLKKFTTFALPITISGCQTQQQVAYTA